MAYRDGEGLFFRVGLRSNTKRRPIRLDYIREYLVEEAREPDLDNENGRTQVLTGQQLLRQRIAKKPVNERAIPLEILFL
jgi:uncharacterized protein YbjT (DUF2867 family)